MSNPRSPVLELCADPASASARIVDAGMAPAVTIAAVRDGGISVAAAGEATASTRFRPGSTTKLITASLVFQLVDEGLLGLDDPLCEHVPELELADTDLAAQVAVRHLISHSSGIDAGDVFVDTGDDDGCIDRYLDELQGRGFLFPPGTAFSYNNAGFVLAGLIVARLRGTTYEDAVRAHLLEPLDMHETTFVTDAEAAMLGPDHAKGHLTSTPFIDAVGSRALAPAGGTLMSTAGDLARFVAVHLGHRPDVLGAPAVEAMRELQASAPGGVATMLGPAFAWMVWENVDGTTVRIGGGFPGFSALLVADPDADAGLVVMTNSDVGINAVTAVLDASGPPATRAVPPLPGDLAPYEGEYVSHVGVTRVDRVDGTLQISASALGVTLPLIPLDGQTFASQVGPVAFVDLDADGIPDILRWRMRAMRRVPATSG